MFVAHAFGGYLCTRQYINRLKNQWKHTTPPKYYLLFGIICSVLPDFDLLYFYTIDNRQHLHHSYWTHIPITWSVVAGLAYLIGRWVFHKRFGVFCLILLMNTWLHLILDTVAGGIYWLYPFSPTNFQWLNITASYDWWVLNYIFHWTFMLELCIISITVYIYHRDKNSGLIIARQKETR